MTFTDLSTAKVIPNPDQPRKLFDPERLQELADSIAANGLLEPIVVRPVDDTYVIVAGERRYRATVQAGLATITAKVMDIAEADAYVLSVAENLNRADMTIMEEADSFAQLLRYGKAVADIAALFGKSATFVEQRLSLLDLCDDARGLVERGRMGPWLAKYVAKLNEANQRTVVNKWARGEFAHETEASEFAVALHEAETQEGFFDLQEPTFEERQQHARRSRQTRAKLDAVARAAELLAEFATESPDDLAAALGNETAARLREVERLAESAGKARLNLRKAAKRVEARTLTIRSEIA